MTCRHYPPRCDETWAANLVCRGSSSPFPFFFPCVSDAGFLKNFLCSASKAFGTDSTGFSGSMASKPCLAPENDLNRPCATCFDPNSTSLMLFPAAI